MIQIEYVNTLLEQGQQPSVKLQLSNDISPETIDKLEKMGIPKSSLKFIQDDKLMDKKLESLLQQSFSPSKKPA